MATETQVRGLEGQLRTCKMEKEDVSIRHDIATRKIIELEEKANKLDEAKRKESNYAEKLGKSHETVRSEREKNRDLLNQNQML